jgi:hypothetical protein
MERFPIAAALVVAGVMSAACPSSSPVGTDATDVADAPDDQAADPAGEEVAHDGTVDDAAVVDAAVDDGTADDVTADGEATDDGATDSPDAIAQGGWGWISVIEWNDTCDQWYQKTQWFGGVRAYFASAPNYNRALPHTLGFATPILTDGSCTLYDTGLMKESCLGQCLCLDKGVECYTEDETERWCGEDEYCVESPADFHGVCAPLPAHFDVGTITLAGLKTPIAMTPDDLDRYIATALPDPDDLFDAGDTVIATTSGGALPPLKFTARGVAPLEVPNPVVNARKGKDSLLKWTPADPESRVQVYLAIGSHDPNPLGGAIVCDVPDGDGQVTIGAALLEKLWWLGCDGAWAAKCSRITRYSRDAIPTADAEVELFVGSSRNVQVLWEMQ